MNKPVMVKECKFCGIRFSVENNKCPKCASSNVGVVIPKYMEVQRSIPAEAEIEEQIKPATIMKFMILLKKPLCVLGSILGGFLLLCIVGSFAIGRWTEWMNREAVSEIVATDEMQSGVSEEETAVVQQYRNGLFSEDMSDEEIRKICYELIENDMYLGPEMSGWDNYAVASVIWDFIWIEGIWEREQSGERLERYDYIELLGYYFKYRNFEDNDQFTAAEKERLEKYITKLREDVESRLYLTEEEWNALYTDVTTEYGTVEYDRIYDFVESIDLDKIWVEKELKAAETLDDEAWKKKMFPIMNELFEAEKDREICLIYDKSFEQERFAIVSEWEHEDFAFYMMRMRDLEWIWPKLDAGETVGEVWYVEILQKYLLFMDYADSEYFSEREKERLKPYYDKVEKYATVLWDFSEGDFKEIYEKNKTESIAREEVEKLVQKWMLQMEQEEIKNMPETEG